MIKVGLNNLFKTKFLIILNVKNTLVTEMLTSGCMLGGRRRVDPN